MTTKKETSVKTPKDVVEKSARDVIENGEKVWFAGLGLIARAQEEGRDLLSSDKTELFGELVGAGRDFADRARQSGQTRFEDVQSAIQNTFDQARGQVTGNYEKASDQVETGVDKIAESLGIDQIFDRRISKALNRLGYPDKKKFDALNRKVNALNRQINPQKKKAAGTRKKSA